MTIVVEPLQNASYQDQQDLQKIHQDAPHWLLAPHGDALQLIEHGLLGGELVVARLNERLLGAARLQRHSGGWHLSQLCVRKITRRRGIAERLVREAQKIALAQGATLHLLAPTGDPQARALAAKLQLALKNL
ncbi:acetyl-CoA sensor PanZ family protein [Pseudomonas sp. PH1b]|uniref:acetyl-CoA sensor PanZ family protein n=1 Tax=Pseudomonas sp. PH1b TaxID=1397282 RepID=UPI00046AA362|nr:acetyl-CoA sensor PanZ family protein [Pseudomonas sp. PH1b]